MKDEDQERRDRALAAVGVTAGALAADSPLALLAAVPEAVRVLRLAWTSWQQDRALLFLRELFGRNLAERELTAAVNDALRKPPVEKAVLQALKAALDAVGDHVLPALAKLVGQYEASGSEPDSHFRACCRLLHEVSAADYPSLVALMRGIAKSEHGGEVHVNVGPGDLDVTVTSYAVAMAGSSIDVTGCEPVASRRLLHLLDREGLASKRVEGRHGEETYLKIEVETAGRIASIL